jgi:transposase
MLVTDGAGTPIGLLLASANRAETALAEPTLGTIRVKAPGRKGPPRTRPRQLVADRGYDSRRLRKALRRRGIVPRIAAIRRVGRWRPRGRPPERRPKGYERRWIVERSFAWLLSFRRLVVRWERRLDLYRAFCLLGLILVCLRRVSE